MPPPNTPEEGLPGIESERRPDPDTETSSLVSEPRDPEPERSTRRRTIQLSEYYEEEEPSVPPIGTSRDGTPDGRRREHSASSSRRIRPTLDWQALKYVSDVSPNLYCPICQSPLVEPVQTRCGHVFCRACFDESLDHISSCPLDRKSFAPWLQRGRYPAKPPPVILNNILDELRVRCPNRRCPRVEPRSAIQRHYEEECEHTRVACVLQSCEKTICRMDQADHCRHGEEPCPHCGDMVDVADLDDHYEDKCTLLPVTCEHCGDEVLRHRYHTVHLRECKEVSRQCQYSAAGCKTTAKQTELGEHERGCPFAAIMRMNTSFRQEMASMEQKLNRQEKTIRDLSSMSPSHGSPPRAWGLSPTSASLAATRPSSREGSVFGGQVARSLGQMSISSATVGPDEEGLSHRDQPLERGGGPGRSHGQTSRAGRTSSDDDAQAWVLAHLRGCEERVDALQQQVHEQNGHYSMMLLNEVLPLRDQLTELRSNMASLGMELRFVMARQKSMSRGGVPAAAGDAATAAGPGDSGADGTRAGSGGGRRTSDPADHSSVHGVLAITPPRL